MNTNYQANDAGEAVRQLNSLLRGEISAAETYKMAIDKLAQSPSGAASNVGLLKQMQEDHGRAAQSLRDRIRELGGQASDSSGTWGTWAATVQGTANIFGDTSALKALKEGEEHGLKDYQRAIDDVDATSRRPRRPVHPPTIPAHQPAGSVDQCGRAGMMRLANMPSRQFA